MHLVASAQGGDMFSNMFWLISYIWGKRENCVHFGFGQFLKDNLCPVFMLKIYQLVSHTLIECIQE